MDAFKQFFDGVGIFFVLYMIGYASFLFLAVTVGTSELYKMKRRNQLKNELLVGILCARYHCGACL